MFYSLENFILALDIMIELIDKVRRQKKDMASIDEILSSGPLEHVQHLKLREIWQCAVLCIANAITICGSSDSKIVDVSYSVRLK